MGVILTSETRTMIRSSMLLLQDGIAKASHTLQPFVIYFAFQSELQSLLIHSRELSGIYQHRHLVSKQENLGEKFQLNFAYEVSLFICKDFFYVQ